MPLCAGQVQIRDADRATLVSWTRSSSARAGLAMRDRIVLAAARWRRHVGDFAPARGIAADDDRLEGIAMRRVWPAG